MHAGADVVYQAVLADGAWRGLADFVERQPDGELRGRRHEARAPRAAAHVLQLCFYTEQIARIQGAAPTQMHVVTGTGERETFRPDDFLAYYRRLRERFRAVVEDGRRRRTRTRSSTAGSATSSRSARSSGRTTTT